MGSPKWRFLIRLRITATSFAPVHALRKKYVKYTNNPYVKSTDYGAIGFMKNFLHSSANEKLLKEALSNATFQQAQFDLRLTHAFSYQNHHMHLKAVYIGLKSPTYSKLYQGLEHDLRHSTGLDGWLQQHPGSDKPVVRRLQDNYGNYPDPTVGLVFSS